MLRCCLGDHDDSARRLLIPGLTNGAAKMSLENVAAVALLGLLFLRESERVLRSHRGTFESSPKVSWPLPSIKVHIFICDSVYSPQSPGQVLRESVRE